MKKIWLAACLLAAGSSLQAAFVTGTAVYDSSAAIPALDGAFGSWTVNFTTTDPAFKLTSVNFNVGVTNLFLDTTFQLVSPGALLNLDFSNLSGGGATGFTSISPATAALRDGATTFTLNFSDFGNAETFGFDLDVDECNNSLNPATSLGCSLVSGAEFAGATITFNFTAPGHPAYAVTAAFADRASTNTQWDAIASFQSTVPEPSTYAMLGSALAAAGLLRRKR